MSAGEYSHMNQSLPPNVIAQQSDDLGNLYLVFETKRGDRQIRKYSPVETVALPEYKQATQADDLADVGESLQVAGLTPLQSDD